MQNQAIIRDRDIYLEERAKAEKRGMQSVSNKLSHSIFTAFTLTGQSYTVQDKIEKSAREIKQIQAFS